VFLRADEGGSGLLVGLDCQQEVSKSLSTVEREGGRDGGWQNKEKRKRNFNSGFLSQMEYFGRGGRRGDILPPGKRRKGKVRVGRNTGV
jgi:hypothetical protein